MSQQLRALLPVIVFVFPGFFFHPMLTGQTAVPDEAGHLVFRADARTVIVDVVVTGHAGKAVHGLRKEDFELTEDGHAEQVAFFEEHKSPLTLPASLPELPPNIFTNVPRMKPVGAVTVLLIDSLNTPTQDQSFVHREMLKYLSEVKPGRRMAIFTLGNRLRYIQGFTSDPAVLMTVLKSQKNGAGPTASPLLRTDAQESAEEAALAQIAAAAAANPAAGFQEALQRLQQFQAEQAVFQNDQRVRMTLDAMQQLGRYLAGIPGRKNVVWFSGSFPLNLFSNPELADSFSVTRDYQEQVRRTDDLLAAAEVAIYPVTAKGLETTKFLGADQAFIGFTTAPRPGQAEDPIVQPLEQQALHSEINHLQSESSSRNGEQATMEQIANETGGQAFFNTNGLDDALDRVADHGTQFYTLAYTPANTAIDGRLRKLQVKLLKEKTLEHEPGGVEGPYHLEYRRGYYGVGAKGERSPVVKAESDPLHPYMGPGMPESTQIMYALRIKAAAAPTAIESSLEINQRIDPGYADGRWRPTSHAEFQQSGEDVSAHAGDNLKLKGKLTRYAVDFVIGSRGLELNQAANGTRSGSLETTLVVYDRDGKPLNWVVRQIDLKMDAARYAQARENGVNFRLEIDAPKEAVTLRSGIYDRSSNLTGTLELPLRSVLVGRAPGLKAR